MGCGNSKDTQNPMVHPKRKKSTVIINQKEEKIINSDDIHFLDFLENSIVRLDSKVSFHLTLIKKSYLQIMSLNMKDDHIMKNRDTKKGLLRYLIKTFS